MKYIWPGEKCCNDLYDDRKLLLLLLIEVGTARLGESD